MAIKKNRQKKKKKKSKLLWRTISQFARYFQGIYMNIWNTCNTTHERIVVHHFELALYGNTVEWSVILNVNIPYIYKVNLKILCFFLNCRIQLWTRLKAFRRIMNFFFGKDVFSCFSLLLYVNYTFNDPKTIIPQTCALFPSGHICNASWFCKCT